MNSPTDNDDIIQTTETTKITTTVITTVETIKDTVKDVVTWKSLKKFHLPSYSISNKGEVKNVGRNKTLKGRIVQGIRYFYLKRIDGTIAKFTIEELMLLNDPDPEDKDEYIVSDETKAIDESHKIVWVSLAFMNLSKYQISNHGEVMNKQTRTILDGYDGGRENRKRFSLSNDESKPRNFKRYNMLMYAFRGIPEDDSMTVDHIDRDSINDNLSNLRWATKREQTLNRKSSTRTRRLVQQSKDGVIIAIHFNYNDATESVNGYGPSVQKACRYQTSYLGFDWLYLDTLDLDDEIWKGGNILFPEFKSFQVSNKYRIRRESGTTEGTLDSRGYMTVTIVCIDDLQKKMSIHRLVQAVFSGERRKDLKVNHINGVKVDNRPENLEYATPKENVQHAVDTGLTNNQKAIQQLTLKDEFIKEFVSGAKASSETGILVGGISRCCRGEQISFEKYHWRFADPTLRIKTMVGSGKISINEVNEEKNIIRTFESRVEAAKILNVGLNTITRHLKSGKWCRKGEFYIEYANSDDRYKYKAKRVIHSTLDGNLINEYSSPAEASESLGYPKISIVRACRFNKIYKGALFAYVI
uniref:HNH endonuclease n=1 Tax=Pithovirus LCPAC406 TaxID=2506599 RepID=A0A481ZI35_9VIRU|nr:MAG: HNH endonuclease [Pithovirus LCPAC406]